MKTKQAIEEVRSTIKRNEDLIVALLKLETALEGFNEELRISTGYQSIDIDNPPRDQAIRIMQHLKLGTWKREQSGEQLNYIHSDFSGNLNLRLYSTPPPASCVITYEDVLIPAQPERIERRPKMTCKKVVAVENTIDPSAPETI